MLRGSTGPLQRDYVVCCGLPVALRDLGNSLAQGREAQVDTAFMRVPDDDWS